LWHDRYENTVNMLKKEALDSDNKEKEGIKEK